MSEHTKEPWHVGGQDKATIYDEFSQRVANSFEGVMVAQRSDATCQANARRIVACVNFCAGADVEVLETAGVGGLKAATDRYQVALNHVNQQLADKTLECATLRDQRDELLAALEAALSALDGARGNINPERGFADEVEAEVSSAIERVSAAIVNVNGGS